MSAVSADAHDAVAATFNIVAGGYDHTALRFSPFAADRLLRYVGPRLDVASGIGAVTLGAAQTVGARGVAIDIAEAMLTHAQQRLRG